MSLAVSRKKSSPKRTRPAITPIRSTPEWKAWLTRLAEFDAAKRRSSVNVSETVDHATLGYALAIGFTEAAPPR